MYCVHCTEKCGGEISGGQHRHCRLVFSCSSPPSFIHLEICREAGEVEPGGFPSKNDRRVLCCHVLKLMDYLPTRDVPARHTLKRVDKEMCETYFLGISYQRDQINKRSCISLYLHDCMRWNW